MDRAKLKELLIAYKEGTLSKEDTALLHTYICADSEVETVHSVLSELMDEFDEDFKVPVQSDEMYSQMIADPRFLLKRPVPLYRWLASVAAVVLVLLVGVWYWGTVNSGNHLQENGNKTVRMSTGTPTDRLVLKTSDGSTIDIDNFTQDTVPLVNTDFFSIRGDEITYDDDIIIDESTRLSHTIATPKGRQFKVVLSDGTKVWLNAATVLTFPVRFDKAERVVHVDGEAYFEVEKSKDWPFVVQSSDQKIKVLGTHFNVLSYKEDQKSYTTLLEGRVEVSNLKEQSILLPGQQSVHVKNNAALSVNTVIAEDAIAWRDNQFAFHREEIQDVMRQVSRWYDVEVEYLDGMEGKYIAGNIPRYENIGQLMEGLAATGLLNYKIEGGTVIISK